jgi:hypothetical protein
MHELEQIVAIFVVAVLLAAAARRVGAPYPVFLALGGAGLAFVPGVPALSLPADLVLALFVAPVLVDAGLRRVAARPARQLGAGRQPRRRRGRSSRRPRWRSWRMRWCRPFLGGGDRARRHRRAARCGRRHGGAARRCIRRSAC